MSSFLSFAAERGLIVEHLSMGRWVRTKTRDHPKKRNGAYFFGGEYGFVQNWRTMERVDTWFADKEAKPNPDVLRRMAEASARQDAKRVQDAARAAEMARAMLSKAHDYEHPYLAAKGFQKARGRVLEDSLLVRMTDLRGAVVGLQEIKMVDGEFRKKFLYGTRASGAIHKLGNEPNAILCEGYATGLSIRAALDLCPMRAHVLVCFSAGNLITVAGKLEGDVRIVADNDASGAGQKAAEATGRPWIMPPTVGHDANDLQRAEGTTAVAAMLLRLRQQR